MRQQPLARHGLLAYTNTMIGRAFDHLGILSLQAALVALGRGGADASYPLTREQIAAEHARLRRTPAGLSRPVVILNGYHTPPQVAWWARLQLSRLTSHRAGDFLTVSYPTETRIERAAEKAITAVERRWPKGGGSDAGAGDGTIEVDVVGISMGGLVARFAAMEAERRTHPLRHHAPGPSRLRIANLYTFATPHQGSMRAALIAPDDAARDMQPMSRFLEALNRAERPYPLVAYTQTRDNLIAPGAAAPPGESALVGTGSRMMSHFTVTHNPWFLADLARRLRREPPLLTPPGGGR